MAAQPSPESHSRSQPGDRDTAANHASSHHRPSSARGLGDAGRSTCSPKPDLLVSAAAAQDMTVDDVVFPCTRNGHRLRLRPSPVKTLPRGSSPVSLVGEGAANAVFRLSIPDGCPRPQDFKGLLLRVAKVPAIGAPLTYDYPRQSKFYSSVMKPMFGEFAVHQELVSLRKSGIVAELNKFLLANNAARRTKFRDSFVGETDVAFLVEDMSPADPDCFLIEFKPKWLSQSPSAPQAAIRCRQCALELQRFITRPCPDKLPLRGKPCPLALATNAPAQVSSPYRIAPHLADIDPQRRWELALRNTANHYVIQQLRAQQDIYDCKGPLNAEPSDVSFSLAMTLRDCTCFAQLSRSGGDGPVKVRLGDFDWKTSEAKFQHWKRTEEELVSGGFYTASRILCGREYYLTPSLCALEWAKTASQSDAVVLHVLDDAEPPHMEVPPPDDQPGSESKVYIHRTDVTVLKPLLQNIGLIHPPAV